jgi:hypothetical protein
MKKTPLSIGIVALSWSVVVMAQAGVEQPAASARRSTAEQLVLTETSHGNVAKFGNVKDEDRTLDSSFLEKLLLGLLKEEKISHEGVHIEHAIIEGRLSLAGAKIGYSTWLNDCQFEDGIDLSDSDIDGTLSVERSVFDGSEGVDLVGMRVQGNVVLRKSVFNGPFNISDARILGSIYGGGAQFVSTPKLDGVFDGVHVGNEIELDNTVSEVSLTFQAAEAQFLSLGRNRALDEQLNTREDARMRTIAKLNLNRAVFHRQLFLRDIDIGTFLARNLRIEGLTLLDKVTIRMEADLSHCQLADLIVSNVTWPADGNSTRIGGLTFQFVSPHPEDISSASGFSGGDREWKPLLAWVRHSVYSPETYEQLEQALKKEGHPNLADETYEAMEEDARSKGDLGWAGILKNYLLQLLIGYGREPQIAFVFSLIVVLFGWWIFRRPEDMEPTAKEYDKRRYKPFWYSLDLFLPISILHDAELWVPGPTSRWRCNYARIHVLLGWILIPIGLAAITGLISAR